MPPPEADYQLDAWQGLPIRHCDMSFFDGYAWTRWTAQHWELPLGAVALYFVVIPLLRAHVAKAGDTRYLHTPLQWGVGGRSHQRMTRRAP